MKKCPNCGTVTDSKFCPECGTSMANAAEVFICPNCGTEASSKFCPECGTAMESAKVTADMHSSHDIADEKENNVVEVDTEPVSTLTNHEASVSANTPGIKKSNKKKIALICAGVLLVIVLIAALGSGGSDSGTTSDTTTSTETTTEEPEVTEEPEEPVVEEQEEPEASSYLEPFTKEEDYSDMSFEDLARDPDKHEGEKFKGSGKVLQVLESDSEVDMRIATSSDGWDDVVYIYYEPGIVDSRILEDDQVTFYGISRGLHSYESTMGGTITLPILYVQKIERN